MMSDMTVRQLDDVRASKLAALPYTYEPVGQTVSGRRPDGFTFFRRSRVLRRQDLDQVSEDLFMWRLHERAGLRVATSAAPLRPDAVVILELGVRPLVLTIPCRVVYVIEETNRRGFAYGTLPGHPEAGEERFMLQQLPAGTIELTVTAFSRPASRLARLGGPLSRRVQHTMTERYLRALDLTE
jgi:uncharacterized protein (UPF0548 family)